MTAGQTREVWGQIQLWYRQAKDHPPPSTREGLEHTSTLREDIYRRRPPEGVPISILAQSAEIPDEPPGGEDTAVAV